ncbi:MAG: sugar-binding protein [Myxococcaceae bacterium]
MKRFKLPVCALIAWLAVTGCGASEGEGAQQLEGAQPDVLVALRASTSVSVDGYLREATWASAPVVVFSNSARSNNRVSVKAVWNTSYLYLGAVVEDAQHETVADGEFYLNDGVEFFLDAGNERSAAPDENDIQILATLRNTSNVSGVLVRNKKVAGTSYTLEVRIPWTRVGTTPAVGKVLGLLLANNDRDSGNTSQFDWLGLIESGSYFQPNRWGSLFLASTTPPVEPSPPPPPGGTQLPAGTLTSPLASAAVTVDGQLSESLWASADYAQFSSSAHSDNAVRAKAAWDATHLYFAFDVTDAQLESGTGQLWLDDGIEVHLDRGNEKSTSMDANDFSFTFNIAGAVSDAATRAAAVTRTGGYILEVAIPWTRVGFTPGSNAVFGLLIGNNDRDNGTSRQFDWVGAIASGSYFNPSLWGSLTLTGGSGAPPPPPPPPPPSGDCTIHVATSGNDANAGTAALPLRSIQRAADRAVAGDIICVHNGTYMGAVRLSRSGTSAAPIHLRSAPNEWAAIDASGASVGLLLQSESGYVAEIGWIIISNLEVRNSSDANIKGYTVHDTVIRNCDIHHSGVNNILLTGATRMTIEANLLRDNGYLGSDRWHGHGIYATGTRYIVRNNLFLRTGCYGVQVAGYSRSDSSAFANLVGPYEFAEDWDIDNNTIALNRGCAGVVTWGGDGSGHVWNVRIRNNIFYRNAEGVGSPNGVMMWNGSNVAIERNVHYRPTDTYFTDQAGGVTGTQSGNINADPLFLSVSSGDFRLQAASPAVDSGLSLPIATDRLGVARPQGAGLDIGAHERF